MQKPARLIISKKETGKRIKAMIHDSRYSISDIQKIMGFENPRAIYKWMAGDGLPSLDNLLLLAMILKVPMEEILVIDVDFYYEETIEAPEPEARVA